MQIFYLNYILPSSRSKLLQNNVCFLQSQYTKAKKVNISLENLVRFEKHSGTTTSFRKTHLIIKNYKNQSHLS